METSGDSQTRGSYESSSHTPMQTLQVLLLPPDPLEALELRNRVEHDKTHQKSQQEHDEDDLDC